ncbi:zinc finger protein 2 homolog [Melanotaenia boesemani]|uniref:zinc finger protein 2 homolog n=1 Tax=Melanotaenia boesemani TaxID=1250792 RepID=UPI001C0460EE|nr:zinc finger protein 2 homolog [Melanotaenia boesemani]
MSPLLLRAFVNERLTAAVEEIFQVFERTIAKYEEEASSSKQEIERLRSLLREFMSNQRTDITVSSDKTREQHLFERRIQHEDSEPRRLKEEDDELWGTEQQVEEQAGEEPSALYPRHSFVWEDSKQEDTKPVLQTQTENCETKNEFQDMQEADVVQFPSSLASTPSSHNERVQDGGESERPAASCPLDQTQTESDQPSVLGSTEPTKLPHLNSAGADYQCYSCAKPFSSHHRLINHAFRFHSQDTIITCAVCGRTFESTEGLDLHLKSHKSSKCCHICGKHCNSTTALTEHMAGHAGVKLHHCHVCGKECSRKGDLKIHMRIHTGEKPFCCSFCCKRFTHSGHLRKHMRSHTGERPHRCEVCGRGFLQSAHLKYHLGTHTQKY